jgi:putative spermidine/putrescine transport system ATP-binding protein
MLDIDTISKSFDGAPAVREASFTVGLGELICLLGPSGCGKSTLLRVISGLTSSDSGAIRIDGADVTAMQANRRPTAMVFQSHALWNHMTVAQNVGFGLRVRGLPKPEIAAKTAAVLELVGLAGFAGRLPAELSGGQAQRVALARCLVVEPKVLLMDEPFSALDAHLRKNLREELKSLQRRLKLTTIFVTHDQEEAMELADRIVIMRAGRVEQVGEPGDLYLHPRTLGVAQFIGSMNTCTTRIVTGRADWFGLPVAAPYPDGEVTILNRPEDMDVHKQGAPARVARVVDLGPAMRVSLITAAGDLLTWTCLRAEAPAIGDDVRLMPQRLHVYRNDGLLGTVDVPVPSNGKQEAFR